MIGIANKILKIKCPMNPATKIRNKTFPKVECGTTVFSDYLKLYLDEWRKYSMKMTCRGSRFPSLPSSKFALHVFSASPTSSAVCPSIRPISPNCGKYRTWLTAHIVDTNESNPRAKSRKFEKQYNTWS